ncbi:MAG: nitroreductase family protein [Marinifilaceae bacterium]|nr:nitroreductase family protein [Marinifilaceae bacterium]
MNNLKILCVLLSACIIFLIIKLNMKPKETVITDNTAESTIDIIHKRKSVRSYTDKKVSQEDLLKLVKAGMAAPTAVNKQPWAFIAIDNREVLDQLAEGLPYAKMLKKATAAIVVCGDTDKALEGWEEIFWVQDCSAATQNILLAAESIGLGAVWTAAYPAEDRMQTVIDILNLPKHIIPLNVIPIGYPKGEQKPKNKWKEENIHWQKW